ncbi:MAG TPA: IS4 family transposase, partial [Burkholderiaceae bacterium]|nr:IS4 family transposase [Burkholderiaceae bacterium]
MDRKAQNALHQRRNSIRRRAKSTEAVEYFNALTSAELIETTEAVLPEHRERLYPPAVTLGMFMRQTLEADGSCQKAVNGWAAQRAADGLSACSTRTGAYCRARQRLPLEMISTITRQAGRQLSQKAQQQWLWRGRTVKLVDGTTVSMPDTPENQAVYPQSSTQAAGVGFPLARLVMVICLATGAGLDAAIGPHRGKGSGELGLVRHLLDGFVPGDVMLADALYCNYFLIAALQARGVDVVFEQNGSRITDFRRGTSLGTRDHIVRWRKPASRPEWMTPEEYA